MSVTRKEIIDRSGRQLSIVSVGMNMAPDDFNIVASVYDGLHERMSINNDIYWGDNDCVPQEVAGLMVSILSGTVVTEDSDFGLADDEIQKITLMQDRAEGELARIQRSVPSGQQVRFKSY